MLENDSSALFVSSSFPQFRRYLWRDELKMIFCSFVYNVQQQAIRGLKQQLNFDILSVAWIVGKNKKINPFQLSNNQYITIRTIIATHLTIKLMNWAHLEVFIIKSPW